MSYRLISFVQRYISSRNLRTKTVLPSPTRVRAITHIKVRTKEALASRNNSIREKNVSRGGEEALRE